MRAGSSWSLKWSSAARSGGVQRPMNWPKTWLRGRRVEEAQGVEPALVLEVLCDLVLDGLQAGEDVAWVWTMPLGSAVVPEVKMIWKGVCRVTASLTAKIGSAGSWSSRSRERGRCGQVGVASVLGGRGRRR